MRKTFLLIIVIFLLAACGGQEILDSVLPTEAPVIVPGPRDFATATPILPATWTPMPTPEGDRIVTGNSSSGSTSGSQSTEGRITYVVVAGDTLGEIAKAYGVSLTALADENDIKNWDVIEVGTVLVIPES